ncbi:hypothetical protein Tco_1107052 [Tanacetum coccineum]
MTFSMSQNSLWNNDNLHDLVGQVIIRRKKKAIIAEVKAAKDSILEDSHLLRDDEAIPLQSHPFTNRGTRQLYKNFPDCDKFWVFIQLKLQSSASFMGIGYPYRISTKGRKTESKRTKPSTDSKRAKKSKVKSILFALSTKSLELQDAFTEVKRIPVSFRKGARYVDSPFVKWPWGRDWSQRLLRVSWHGPMYLAIFALEYHISCIPVHGWPIISGPHGFGDHESRSSVHAA